MTAITCLNTIDDLDDGTLLAILDGADAIEQHIRARGHAPDLLRGKCLAMVFDEVSLRTRSAFERAMYDFGGHAISYSGKETRIGRHAEKPEHLPDFVNVIGRFNDALLTRIYDHRVQAEIASLSPVPFINGMCDRHHPTQALCDFLTIRRRFGRVEGLKVAFVGDGTNIACSLAQTAARLGARFAIATPEGWGLPAELVGHLEGFCCSADPFTAVCDADVVVGDAFVPMNKHTDAERRRRILLPYRITASLMAVAKPHAIFLHSLPASRGDEVESEVIDGPQSVIYEEAVARLHIARSLLLYMLRADADAQISGMRIG